MQDPKPFWETGVHPVTGKKEFTKILTSEQKQLKRISNKKHQNNAKLICNADRKPLHSQSR